jgi:hypothetical protein
MKQTVLMFVLIVAGASAGKTTAPSQIVAGSLVSNSSETSNVAGSRDCCGGPLCIPHEPCGPGVTKLKIS